jgi:uncharacterized membrane protein YbhN (UPF0104 family)
MPLRKLCWHRSSPIDRPLDRLRLRDRRHPALQLLRRRGITVLDVAKIQVFFTATFTLGVATLAGGVLLLEPDRLAAVSGLPAGLWRLGAATSLAVVAAYVAWGVFSTARSHPRPDVRAAERRLHPHADLLRRAPTSCGGGGTPRPAAGRARPRYVEVLAVFMPRRGRLMSHVPGSLGVFESAVILLVSPRRS